MSKNTILLDCKCSEEKTEHTTYWFNSYSQPPYATKVSCTNCGMNKLYKKSPLTGEWFFVEEVDKNEKFPPGAYKSDDNGRTPPIKRTKWDEKIKNIFEKEYGKYIK